MIDVLALSPLLIIAFTLETFLATSKVVSLTFKIGICSLNPFSNSFIVFLSLIFPVSKIQLTLGTAFE